MSNPSPLNDQNMPLPNLQVTQTQLPLPRPTVTVRVNDVKGAVTSIFDKYNINLVRQLVGELATKEFNNAKRYYEGDHWHHGEGWVGPCPAEGDIERVRVIELIRKAFVYKNAVAEVVDRHVDSLLARLNSCWKIVPTTSDAIGGPDIDVRGPVAISSVLASDTPPVDPEAPSPTSSTISPQLTPQQKLAIEVTPALMEWWHAKHVESQIRQAVTSMLWGSRGGLRLFIPSGKLKDGNVPKKETLRDQLQYIYIEHPDPSTAAMDLDRATMEEVYINFWFERDPSARSSYMYCEISFVDFDTGLTVVKSDSNNPMAEPTVIVMDIDKQNIFFEMKQKPMVTESMISLQKLLNKSLTMLSRNVDIGGFLERTILNADLPGEWVVQRDGKKKYVPAAIQVGAGKTTVLSSQVIEDDEGRKIVLPVDMRYRDPVTVDTFVNTKNESYVGILEEADQTFILAGEYMSGEARVQARASFATSLANSKVNLDLMVVWVLNTALQLAGTFQGDKTRYNEIKAISDLKPDTGPLTPQERDIVINMYKSGLMSRDSAMSILGVDDPDSEILRINQEKRITTPAELAAILTALSKTGWELSWDQLPEVDDNILGLSRRDVQKYIEQLKQIAEIQAPTGANSGSSGGSPKGSVNKPGSDSPGPGESPE